jgi:4-diphosphocytidyl-2-C-methyl-D-erythritol kinase
VSASLVKRVARRAHAKLNLGLEVLGRRDDGFHELATIFVAIDLCDDLVLSAGDELSIACNDPELAGEDNLAMRAIRILRSEMSHPGGAKLEIEKHIPTAAGLGGASSDAAAALLAARELWGIDVPDDRLHAIAGELGSDVPFFLRGGCALGQGRGERLTPLPLPRETWFVLVVPAVAIPNKTARLYGLLISEDFGDGSRVAAQASRLQGGLGLDPELLNNAFVRPLYALCLEVAELPGIMAQAGALSVALSGAGPAHYAVVHDPAEAERLAARLRERLGRRSLVTVTRPVPAWSTRSGPL